MQLQAPPAICTAKMLWHDQPEQSRSLYIRVYLLHQSTFYTRTYLSMWLACSQACDAVCRIRTRKGVVLAAGAWSGSLLGSTTGDARWREVFKPRRGHLLELHPPAGMPPLRHGLMEMGYTQVQLQNVIFVLCCCLACGLSCVANLQSVGSHA